MWLPTKQEMGQASYQGMKGEGACAHLLLWDGIPHRSSECRVANFYCQIIIRRFCLLADSSYRSILYMVAYAGMCILASIYKLSLASRKCLPTIVQVLDFLWGRQSPQCLVPMRVSSKSLNNHFVPLLKVKSIAQECLEHIRLLA